MSQIVQRDILTSERGSVTTFNDLPEPLLAEARAIARESRAVAVRYLQFYVEKQDNSSSADFVEDVLLGDQAPGAWRIRDCLICPHPLTLATVLERPYLDCLLQIEGERWFRVRPSPEDHRSDLVPGIVGVLRRDSRYWEVAPDNTGQYFIGEAHLDRLSPGGLETSVRRWIAHVLAWWARDYLADVGAHVREGELLASIPECDCSKVTPDARRAATALAREVSAYCGSQQFPQLAGFIGPDEWYAD
jgi:hypothetical protein